MKNLYGKSTDLVPYLVKIIFIKRRFCSQITHKGYKSSLPSFDLPLLFLFFLRKLMIIYTHLQILDHASFLALLTIKSSIPHLHFATFKILSNQAKLMLKTTSWHFNFVLFWQFKKKGSQNLVLQANLSDESARLTVHMLQY